MHSHRPLPHEPDDWMRLALEQAQLAVGLSDPNPRVGCVLVSFEGILIGMGHTQQAGGPHAEVMALRDAQSRGHSTKGATAYVTLEPCAHHGRTPPCCDALIRAEVARVFVALEDPFPMVCGQGIARLRDAGIKVSLWPDDALRQTAQALNMGFFSRVQRGRPWVRLKAATSLDGRTALSNGVSQWITGEAARIDAHFWRRRAGAILTGVGTVLADNPRLDVRYHPCPTPPMRVVLDRHLRTPTQARLFDAPGSVLLYTHEPRGGTAAFAEFSQRQNELQGRGAQIQCLPPVASVPQGLDAPDSAFSNLEWLLRDLAARGVNELHVEAGHTLNASFLAQGWVDELLIYLAPQLIGQGPGLAALPSYRELSETIRLDIFELERIGPDLRIRAHPRP